MKLRAGVIGINHKLADLNLREAISRACHKRFGLENSSDPLHAFVLLSTCNRMELYFSSADLAQAHSHILNILSQEVSGDYEQKLYSFFGIDCFCHLSKVAAGLDSAIFGETEIQGQVNRAYEASAKAYPLPKHLHYLFQKSLKISKSIREKYAFSRGLPDLEHAIFQTGSSHFEAPHQKSILFVGASEINQKVMEHLKKKGCQDITLCNRNEEKGKTMASQFQIPLLPWDSLFKWPSFDWVIFGTKSPHHLVSAKSYTPSVSQKLMIDLSFPRNVDPLLGQHGVKLINIQELNGMLQSQRSELELMRTQAQSEVYGSVQRHMEIFKNKQLRVSPSRIYPTFSCALS